MNLLDRLIPAPRLVEIDHADVAAPPERIWELVRHGDLARSPIARALFALRAIPSRLAGKPTDSGVRVDDLRSTPQRPGFQVLVDDPPREFAVGAIGQVWKPEIPFIHVADPAAYAAFAAADFVKVAWAFRLLPRGERGTRVELEVRVDATDAPAWTKFRRYFRFIGPASRFMRRALLAGLVRELGAPAAPAGPAKQKGRETMKTALGLILLLTIVATTVEAAGSERWSLELRAGGAAPTGTFAGADLATGFGFGATVAYRVQPHLHLYGGWGWRHFGVDDVLAGPDAAVEQTGYVYGARFVHPFSESSTLAYRLHAGGTYEHFELEAGDDLVADSGHGVGWEAGLGIVVPMGTTWRIEPGMSYRSLSRDVTIGVTTTPATLRAVGFDVGLTRRF